MSYWTAKGSRPAPTAPITSPKHPAIEKVRQIGLVCRGERQTLQGKFPKLSRISHTIGGKLDELPTDLDTKLLGSIRINKRLMRSHYQPDRIQKFALIQ